jgi:hypothetical protein
MAKALSKTVRDRANDLCEYCHAPQQFYPERLQLDHITARQHDGETSLDNLALCCLECNSRKGTNLTGIDPESRQITPLFHPRKDKWNDHFAWRGGYLVGLTAIGRATIAVLDINRPPRVAVREALIDEGVFPPTDDRRAD